MNNPTGETQSKFLHDTEHFRLKHPMSTTFGDYSELNPDTKYRVHLNVDGSEQELNGAELLRFFKQVLKTTLRMHVLARCTIMRA